LKRYAIEHGTVDANPAVPAFEQFVGDHFVPLVMPRDSPATRERYERLLWKEGVNAALGPKRLNEVGAGEFRALEAAVRGRAVHPRQHLIIMRVPNVARASNRACHLRADQAPQGGRMKGSSAAHTALVKDVLAGIGSLPGVVAGANTSAQARYVSERTDERFHVPDEGRS
jgi:hypothetical protein